MITETGTVTRIEEDAAWVTTVSTSACNGCKAKSGCGQRLLNGALGANMDIRARFNKDEFSGLMVGDRVAIGIEEGAVVGASLLAYGVPIVLMVLLSFWFGQSSLFSGIAAALIGLGVGGIAVRLWLSQQPDSGHFEPIILRRFDPPQAGTAF